MKNLDKETQSIGLYTHETLEPVAWYWTLDGEFWDLTEKIDEFSPKDKGFQKYPLYLHPAPQQANHGVLMITTAYEQGVGKGHQARARGAEIENPYGDAVCREAWQLGYEEGKQQADRQRVPEGYVLVPVEPTEAMVDAGSDAGDGDYWSGPITVYAAMLAAAPEAPAQADAFNTFAGNVVAVTNQTAYGGATAYFPELPETSSVDERAAFEAWWKGDLLDWRGHQNVAALHAWEGWQARAALK